MNAEAPSPSPQNENRKQRSVRLSVEAWAALQGRSALEGRAATRICEFLLSHYLDLENKSIFDLPADLEKSTRVLYTTNQQWARVKQLAVLQKRSASGLLEQLIRAYLGLSLGERRSIHDSRNEASSPGA
jgi:hypothetical protein